MALRAVTSNGVAITPSSVSLPTGGTFDLYNTADQTTNYERLRADWSGSIARVFTQFSGSAGARILRVGASVTGAAPDSYIDIRAGTPFLNYVTPTTSQSVGNQWNGAFSASSGTQTALSIANSFNQSGTAGYIVLDVNPTETATGSGTKLLQRWAVGGSTQAQMNAAGTLWLSYVAAIQNIGFTNSIGSANDVTLTRDAADTLALRRDTKAQTFRVYNTYTDGSNYRRWDLSWNTTTAIMQVVGAGTGTNGNLAVGNAALETTATVGYFMIPSSAGAPTGVPADIPTGQVALHFDSTNNKLYVYDGGWLSTAALT